MEESENILNEDRTPHENKLDLDNDELDVSRIKLKYTKGVVKKSLLDTSQIKISKYKPTHIEKLKQKYTLPVPSEKVPIDYTNIKINGNISKEKNLTISDKKVSKLKKKSKKFKSTPDPDVNNISDLLSNSLMIESPDKSLTDNKTMAKNKNSNNDSTGPKNKNKLSLNSNVANLKECDKDNIIIESKNNSITIDVVLVDEINNKLINVKKEKSLDKNKHKSSSKAKEKQKLSLSKNENDKKDNCSTSTKKVIFRTDQNISFSPTRVSETSNSEENDAIIEKKNAFQFMMDSRNKSIGTNSPGKDKTEENIDPIEFSEKKGKLKNRKLFLEEWSDKKGGIKRKLDEDAKEKCIEKKLNKRAKRLKKMLTLKNNDIPPEEDSNDFNPIRHKNKKAKVLTDSENSNDSEKSFSSKTKIQDIFDSQNIKENIIEEKVTNSKQKLKSEERDIIFTPPAKSSKNKESDKISSKEKNFEDKNDLILSPSLKKTSLLHYFDVSNKQSKNISIVIDDSPKENKNNVLKITNNIEPTELIKIKLNFTPKKSKNKNESIVNENISDSSKLKKIKRKHKHSLSLKKTEPEHNSDENKSEKFEKLNDKTILSSKIKKTFPSKNEQTVSPKTEKKLSPKSEETISSKSISFDNSPILSSKTKNTKELICSNIKSIQTPKSKKEKLEDSSQYTPRTWRMKVRLFEKEELENIEKDEENSDDDIEFYDDEIFPAELNKSTNCTPLNKNLDKVNERLVNSEPKKEVKIAPLFLKSKKSDVIAANEAKKRFLLSGVPLKMRKMLKQQKSVNSTEDFELSIFPNISHVQQREENDIDFWDLPNTSLILPEIDENNFDIDLESMRIGTFTNCKTITDVPKCHKTLHAPPKILQNLKYYIKELKKEFPNYPVYKVFRLLREKCGTRFALINPAPIEVKEEEKVEKDEKPVKKRRGRPKKKKEIVDDNSVIIDLDASDITPSQKTELSTAAVSIWTEKYKPQSSEDIIGNSTSVTELKNWLQTWVDYSIEQRTTNKKRKRTNSNSSSDFCSDSDTRDTDIIPQNTMILIGSYGTGKTSTVYALCNELNINVIELNASSKRPGKKILLDLQEATKSHQVKNTDYSSVNNFFQKSTSQENANSQEDEIGKKLTLLLIEDADLVFDDQDEGFINAITTLIASSKRPIIITSSDLNCAHLQKFFSQHKVLMFNPLSSKMLGTWLEILCLVEGVRVNKTQISRLLDLNKGDMRKTILQLQFWTLSGGDPLKKSRKKSVSQIIQLLKSSRRFSTEAEVGYEDESSNLSWMSGEESQSTTDSEELEKIHHSCLECFIPYCQKDKHKFQLPYPVNLGNIWWNMPNIFGIKSAEHAKIFTNSEIQPLKIKENLEKSIDSPVIFNTQESVILNRKTNLNELNAIGDLLDSIAFADVIYTRIKHEDDFEPCPDYWKIKPVNSLSVLENRSNYRENDLISLELTQWLIENNLRYYRDISNNKLVDLDFIHSTPVIEERRWRKKQHTSMEGLSVAVPDTSQIDRRSLCLDYQSTLRSISRCEQLRSISNNKRNNRFYHYLRGLHVNLTDSMYEVVCNTLAHFES